MCRGGFAGRGWRCADRTRVIWHARSAATRSMTVCPPSVLAPDVQRKRCRTPETLQSAAGATAGTRFLLRQRRPSGARRWPAAASFGGLVASASPVPRRFAHRTTDMAPMLRHADPCRASPCRPCCLLSASGRASREVARRPEALPVRRLPKRSWDRTPGMLRFESSSSSVILLSISAIFSFKPCFSGAQGGRCQQRVLKLPDVGSTLRSHNAELRHREAPSGSPAAAHCRIIPCDCCSSVFTATNVGRDAASAIVSASFTLDGTRRGGSNLTSQPNFSRPRLPRASQCISAVASGSPTPSGG